VLLSSVGKLHGYLCPKTLPLSSVLKFIKIVENLTASDSLCHNMPLQKQVFISSALCTYFRSFLSIGVSHSQLQLSSTDMLQLNYALLQALIRAMLAHPSE